jgi:hypothetical protein
MSIPALGTTQPQIQWITGVVTPEIKRQELEADHSPSFSADVKNGGAIPPLLTRLHGRVLN